MYDLIIDHFVKFPMLFEAPLIERTVRIRLKRLTFIDTPTIQSPFVNIVYVSFETRWINYVDWETRLTPLINPSCLVKNRITVGFLPLDPTQILSWWIWSINITSVNNRLGNVRPELCNSSGMKLFSIHTLSDDSLFNIIQGTKFTVTRKLSD